MSLRPFIAPRPMPRPTPREPECAPPPAPAGAHGDTPPVHGGFARVVDYGTKPKTGMTAKFQLLDDLDRHPFKGMKASRTAGHRLHIVVSQPRAEGEPDAVLYVGEGMLTWWAEDCVNGMTAIVRFDDGPDGAQQHPLTGLEPGYKDGDAVYVACWAVDDDESVQHPAEARRRARKPFASMSAVQQSQIKCRLDAQFQEWCATEAAELLDPLAVADLPDFNDSPVVFAESVVRAFCGVSSRSEFSADTAAAFEARQRWQRMLRMYDAWRRPEWAAGDLPGRAG